MTMIKLRMTNALKTSFPLILMVMAGLMSTACDAWDGVEHEAGLTMTPEEFPMLDCSTSTQPLSVILAAKVLGLPYRWWQDQALTQVWYVAIDWAKTSLTESQRKGLEKKLNCSTTHGSYMNLLDGKVELIIASRDISRAEREYADSKGVRLATRPIGKDGFVFMVNKANRVASLTNKQIQDIYTGTTRNWKDVGGSDATIHPYIRNANSGSQEKMETMVMKGLTMIDWPEMATGTMAGPFYAIRKDVDGIAYTPYYYYNMMTRGQGYAKTIGIDGIAPDSRTINNEAYPYVSEICAAVRADIDCTSSAYRLFEYLTHSGGQSVVEESGYVPLATSAREWKGARFEAR